MQCPVYYIDAVKNAVYCCIGRIFVLKRCCVYFYETAKLMRSYCITPIQGGVHFFSHFFLVIIQTKRGNIQIAGQHIHCIIIIAGILLEYATHPLAQTNLKFTWHYLVLAGLDAIIFVTSNVNSPLLTHTL